MTGLGSEKRGAGIAPAPFLYATELTKWSQAGKSAETSGSVANQYSMRSAGSNLFHLIPVGYVRRPKLHAKAGEV